MTQWRVLEADRRTTYCPIALELRDEFTGGPVIGEVEIELDLQQGALWTPSGRRPVRTPGGLFVFTGLGRAFDPAAMPSFKVRVRISAAYYRPGYRSTVDGLEFDVATYNHAVPPAVTPLMPEIVLMQPGSAYPFGGHLRVLRGRVLDSGGDPVADASVEADGVERVISDDNGAFGLPLRWQLPNAGVAVLVDHPRSGRAAAAAFNLPGDLAGNHDITIT
jgi:hypothetical protein